VHVERDANRAKFWLEPVRLHESGGFGRMEIGRLRSIVMANQSFLARAWHEFFGE
jgi:hypothetical protein